MFNMNQIILIRNDGKGEMFSFDASIEEDRVKIVYGESKEDVINKLKQEVNEMILKLQNIDYTNVRVQNLIEVETGDKI